MSCKVGHLALIMDGNGRWATNQGLSRLQGHEAGARTFRTIVEICPALGIRCLTVFAFSTENWKRSEDEVMGLMGLMDYYLQQETEHLVAEGVRLTVIGQRDRLSPHLRARIEDVERRTHDNTRLLLQIAVSYGGRWDIVQAAKRAAQMITQGLLSTEQLDEASFGRLLSTGHLPPVDLLIRVSGEIRVSNYLLWEIAYAEMIFHPKLWPDFTGDDLRDCLDIFSHRQRRFGESPPL